MNTYWTEKNQKAEFIGGAIAGGCALAFMAIVFIFIISAFVFCSDGCS